MIKALIGLIVFLISASVILGVILATLEILYKKKFEEK